MPEVPLAQKKLREARFFLGHLQSEEQSGLRNEEHFAHYLSAFLSAARSVVYQVYRASGSGKEVDAWKATRNAEDRTFFDSIKALRDSEVHNEGVTIRTQQEAIPMPLSAEPRDPTTFAAFVQLGYFSSARVYINRHYVDLEEDRLEAVPTCERLVALLEDLLRSVDKL
jgi:hypothetical protein